MRWRSGKSGLIACWFIALSIVLQQNVSPAQGNGNGVQVRPAVSQLVETQAGSSASLSFTVANATDREQELVESLDMPAQWRAVNPPTTITLEGQKTRARIFAVLIPANAPAGEYEVSYSVRGREESAIRDAAGIKVGVLPVSKLTLLAEETPDTAIAGDEYRVKLRLLNQGNAESSVSITSRSTQDSTIDLEPAEVRVPAGASQVVVARVKTSDKTTRRVKDYILFQVRRIDADDTVAAGLSVSTDIVPKRAGEGDAFHRIPVKISMSAMDDGDRSGNQVRFSGSGDLGASGGQSFEFLFRTPGILGMSMLGRTAQQYLNYHAGNVDLRVGDQSYSLSPLTDYYRYGHGLAIDLRQPHSYGLGAFSVQQPWGELDERETGAYLRKEFGKDLALKFNALERRQSNPAGFRDRLWSMEATAKPAPNTSLALEYGYCSSDRNGTSGDKAYAVKLHGGSRGTFYSLQKTYAGPDYHGYYRDVDYTNGTVSFPLSTNLRGRLLFHKWRRNPGCDTARGPSPEETRGRVGLSYKLAPGLSISLDGNWFHRRDIQTPSTCDYAERAFRVGVGKSVRNSSIYAYAEAGKRDDYLTGAADRINRFSINYGLKPSPRFYCSVYAQLGDTLEEDTRLFGGRNCVGFCGRWEPSDRLACMLRYGIYQSTASGQPDIHQTYLAAAYRLAAGNRLSLCLRRLGGGYETVTCILSYEMPWSLPVARKRDWGTIRGRVYDSEQPGQPGIPRVVVTANDATTSTDENGRFVLNSLTAGTYSLSVDRNSIGLDRMATVKLPMTIDVESNLSSEVEIPVVRSAALVGKVSVSSRGPSGSEIEVDGSNVFIEGDRGSNLAGGPGASGLKDGLGLSNILLELSRGPSEVLRTLTDERGEFSFDDLAPGRWKLTVYDHNLPAFYRLEDGQRDLDLSPGARDSVALRVVPCIRPVKMIEQGLQLQSMTTGGTSASTETVN